MYHDINFEERVYFYELLNISGAVFTVTNSVSSSFFLLSQRVGGKPFSGLTLLPKVLLLVCSPLALYLRIALVHF